MLAPEQSEGVARLTGGLVGHQSWARRHRVLTNEPQAGLQPISWVPTCNRQATQTEHLDWIQASPQLKVERFFFFFKILFIYSWETQRERKRHRQREAGSSQEAQCGTWSQDPRITHWAEGRCSTTEPLRCPKQSGKPFCEAFHNPNWCQVKTHLSLMYMENWAFPDPPKITC